MICFILMIENSTYIKSANKRIARNSIFMSIRMVIVLCLTFYTTRVVLSVLGVDDYGVYNVVCGFVSMFSFLTGSMSNGIQRFFNYELGKNGEEGANKVYNTAVIIQLIIATIIIIFIEIIGNWYLHNKMVIPLSRMYAAECIFQFAILSFSFNILQAPFLAAIMAHEKMDFYAMISILDAILKLAIAFLLTFLSGDNLIIYGFLFSLISFFNFFVYYIYARLRFDEIRIKWTFHKELFFSMIGFSGWNFFGSFASVMKEQGMNLVLNLFYGPVVNAARGVSHQINAGLQAFVQNISIPVRPQVIQSYAKEDYNRCLKLFFSISKLSCCFIFLLSFPVILEIDYILHLWLGNNIPDHTHNFVAIIILVTYVNNLNAPVSAIVHASGKMKVYQTVTSLISLMCIPTAYVLMKLGYSSEVALFMVFVFCAISQFVALKILQGMVTFRLYDYYQIVLKPFFTLVIVTFIFPLLPRYFMDESIIRVLIVFAISFVTIGWSFYYIVLDKSEKGLVIELYNQKLKRK